MRDGDEPNGAARLSRRSFLGLGAAAAAAALIAPGEALASTRVVAVRPRVISILNVNTGERLENVEYWARGRYLPDALRALDRIMRDHRTDTVHEIDPSLFDLVVAVQSRLEASGPIHLVSGYRSPQTNAQLRRRDPGVARNSFHMRGEAMDLRVPGITTRNLYRAAVVENEGGVGFYPRTDFIHLDVGPSRTWGPGSRREAARARGQEPVVPARRATAEQARSAASPVVPRSAPR
jgi:uncharacterized protein YcbK (DUF882 family)